MEIENTTEKYEKIVLEELYNLCRETDPIVYYNTWELKHTTKFSVAEVAKSLNSLSKKGLIVPGVSERTGKMGIRINPEKISEIEEILKENET